jgi:hypothetical protein
LPKEEFEMELPKPSELGAGNFVTPADIGTSKTCTIAEGPHKVESTFKNADGSTQYRMRLALTIPGAKGQKLWTMNNTSYKKLYSAFGANPKKWVGVKVRLVVVPQNVRGSMRDVIYGEPA